MAGNKKKAFVIGAKGGMGHWFVRFFESAGYAVTTGDTRTDSEDVLSREIKTADVILISVQPSKCSAVIKKIAATGTGAVVFDICSIKAPIINALRDAARAGLKITSTHPMFGPDIADIKDRNIIVCDCGNRAATEAVKKLFSSVAVSEHSNISETPLERHDALMAYVLALPHAMNISFVAAIKNSGFSAEELENVGGSTFARQLDLARRVVSQNPGIYYEIQSLNDATVNARASFKKEFERLEDIVRKRKRKEFIEHMKSCMRWTEREK